MDAINDPNTPNMDAPESGDSPERERMARGDRKASEMRQGPPGEGQTSQEQAQKKE